MENKNIEKAFECMGIGIKNYINMANALENGDIDIYIEKLEKHMRLGNHRDVCKYLRVYFSIKPFTDEDKEKNSSSAEHPGPFKKYFDYLRNNGYRIMYSEEKVLNSRVLLFIFPDGEECHHTHYPNGKDIYFR